MCLRKTARSGLGRGFALLSAELHSRPPKLRHPRTHKCWCAPERSRAVSFDVRPLSRSMRGSAVAAAGAILRVALWSPPPTSQLVWVPPGTRHVCVLPPYPQRGRLLTD